MAEKVVLMWVSQVGDFLSFSDQKTGFVSDSLLVLLICQNHIVLELYILSIFYYLQW